jgi:hypothetical protein
MVGRLIGYWWALGNCHFCPVSFRLPAKIESLSGDKIKIKCFV